MNFNYHPILGLQYEDELSIVRVADVGYELDLSYIKDELDMEDFVSELNHWQAKTMFGVRDTTPIFPDPTIEIEEMYLVNNESVKDIDCLHAEVYIDGSWIRCSECNEFLTLKRG